MKIIRPTDVRVEFEDYRDAAKFLAQYVCTMEQRRTIEAGPCPDNGITLNRRCAREAVVVLAEKFGVTLPAATDPQHAAPTYVSGSSDKVYLLSEMPTRYMVNVLHMDSERQARGLFNAIKAELRRRGESA
jgi:propanediol dehydratase large subunit